MKAPDKIYLNTPKVYANSSDSYECSTWATKEYDNCENTEYIRKDALLEWAKAKKAELLNEELTDVAAGINMGMDMLIYKLEQL